MRRILLYTLPLREHLMEQMSTFALLSTVLSLAALFGYLSHRILRLPTTVGTMMLALLLSAALLLLGNIGGGVGAVLNHSASMVVHQINLGRLVLHGMLAYLLFAAALQLDLHALADETLPVTILATVGTVMSTVLVAGLLYVALPCLGLRSDPLFCLLFGALIAPTDPVAVLGMLRRVGAPIAIEMRLAGESLFNDGVGAVLFLALLGAAADGNKLPGPGHFLLLLLRQAGGGIALGFALGYVCYWLIRHVDEYRVEVTLTLALATGSYALADALHLSAPLAVIAAGVLVNGRARYFAMSDTTRHNVETFWDLADEILNVVLFLLLGLELLSLQLHLVALLAGLLALAAVLLARYISVAAILGVLRLQRPHVPGSVRILTWAGLRGGLSVALALGLPAGHQRTLALTMTYVVVIFSILVQGMTVGPLLRRMNMTQVS